MPAGKFAHLGSMKFQLLYKLKNGPFWCSWFIKSTAFQSKDQGGFNKTPKMHVIYFWSSCISLYVFIVLQQCFTPNIGSRKLPTLPLSLINQSAKHKMWGQMVMHFGKIGVIVKMSTGMYLRRHGLLNFKFNLIQTLF